jgi:hypothetical protein
MNPQGARTDGCSTAVVMMWSPTCARAKNAPLTARLFASLPPLVKTTSSDSAPSIAATLPRASSKAAFAGALAQWLLDGLPKAPSRNGRIAAATAGSIGVLAL